MPIKIINAAKSNLQENPIIRGVIHNDSIAQLKYDLYQREKLSESTRYNIQHGLRTGVSLPDIEIGMRGDRYEYDRRANTFLLLDPCYGIDGRQRIETLIDYLNTRPDKPQYLGATVHLNTDPEWETARFHILGSTQIKVAPSILLRNLRHNSPGLTALYNMSTSDPLAVMNKRVCWSQKMNRGELITGLAYVRIALRLHAHLAPTRTSITADNALAIIDRVVDRDPGDVRARRGSGGS